MFFMARGTSPDVFFFPPVCVFFFQRGSSVQYLSLSVQYLSHSPPFPIFLAHLPAGSGKQHLCVLFRVRSSLLYLLQDEDATIPSPLYVSPLISPQDEGEKEKKPRLRRFAT